MLEVYVNDFIALAILMSKTQLDHVANMTHTVLQFSHGRTMSALPMQVCRELVALLLAEIWPCCKQLFDCNGHLTILMMSYLTTTRKVKLSFYSYGWSWRTSAQHCQMHMWPCSVITVRPSTGYSVWQQSIQMWPCNLVGCLLYACKLHKLHCSSYCTLPG